MRIETKQLLQAFASIADQPGLAASCSENLRQQKQVWRQWNIFAT
jgi:hypothetical protein